jgi:hypothetical protein
MIAQEFEPAQWFLASQQYELALRENGQLLDRDAVKQLYQGRRPGELLTEEGKESIRHAQKVWYSGEIFKNLESADVLYGAPRLR